MSLNKIRVNQTVRDAISRCNFLHFSNQVRKNHSHLTPTGAPLSRRNTNLRDRVIPTPA